MPLSEKFKALSDTRRRQVLELLLEGPHAAGDIAARFDITAATVSHHLSQLKKAGLVRVTRSGTFLYYELEPDAFVEVKDWIQRMEGVQ